MSAARIETLRDSLIDCDIVVEDCRHDLDRAISALHHAVQQRDRVVQELQAIADLLLDYELSRADGATGG